MAKEREWPISKRYASLNFKLETEKQMAERPWRGHAGRTTRLASSQAKISEHSADSSLERGEQKICSGIEQPMNSPAIIDAHNQKTSRLENAGDFEKGVGVRAQPGQYTYREDQTEAAI